MWRRGVQIVKVHAGEGEDLKIDGGFVHGSDASAVQIEKLWLHTSKAAGGSRAIVSSRFQKRARHEMLFERNGLHLPAMMPHNNEVAAFSEERIRVCDDADFETVCRIINDSAVAYRGVIPPDRWSEPYMPRDKLRYEIAAGVVFWGCEWNQTLAGVIGIQTVEDVTLIRHAYVRTGFQKRGVGGRLLSHLLGLSTSPVLIGTWADADWAIRFYERHGFRAVSMSEKERLLRTYWSIPERQVETSVVLADPQWWKLATQ